MVVFFGEGRLGNQLFQYAFIKNFSKRDEMIVTCNFEDFLILFEIKDRIFNFRSRTFIFIAKKIINRFLKVISHLRIISCAMAQKESIDGKKRETDKYIFKKGFLSITFIFPGYYQSENFFNKNNLKGIKIKDKYIKKAKKFLGKITKGRKKIFMHIRRGDYKKINHWFLGEQNFILPKDYYKKAIKYLENKNNFYIILSDDVSFAENNFIKIKSKLISKNSMFVDFTIMTLCDGGILSNSSFSWWGAYLMKKNKSVLVPKYWFGFNNKIVHPAGIYPNFSKKINF